MSRNRIAVLIALFITPVLVALAAVPLVAAEEKAAAKEGGKQRYFEMRIYTAAPGKMDALHKRFRDHTNRLLEKHGATNVGHWEDADEDKLAFILAYPSREAREKTWQAFQNDPEWKKAKAASESDGTPLATKVESVFLKPTYYSPIK